MWLPDRPASPVVDNWPPRPLPIYADLEYEMTEPRQTDKAQTPGDDSPDEGPRTDTVPTEDAELESGDEGERKQDD